MVATPIGNLGDISRRAREVLAAVDTVAAEDTRHSRQLLSHFGIQAKLLALHEHNERGRVAQLLGRLEAGEALALVSDAGTPLISDPGFHLVREVRAAGYPVIPVPGASALIAALSVSGLPTDRFVFEGFLPAKSAARRRRLEELAGENRTLAFYESSHRIGESLADMAALFGEAREAVLAKELTKTFETVRGDSLGGLCTWLAAEPERSRGEFVLLVHGAARPEAGEVDAAAERVLRLLLAELAPKRAVKLAAEITSAQKNALYRLALEWKGK